MKKLLVAFVLFLAFAGITNAQTTSWFSTISVENVELQFKAVTVDNYIDNYYVTASGSVGEGWTADVFGEIVYQGPISFGWESEWVWTSNPKSQCYFEIFLNGPEGYHYVAVELYWDEDLQQFQLWTDKM